jgi:rhodanese-related sulfurtransferase
MTLKFNSNRKVMVMKKVLVLAAALAVLSAPLAYGAEPASNTPANAAAAQEYKAKTPRLKRAEIDALLANPDKVLVIDVRRPDELTAIGGFPVFLSIQNKDLENHLAFIPKDRAILTVSNHAHRAGAAGDLLTAKGFKVAGAAGVKDYEAEGGTLVKIAPPAPKTAEAEKH